MRLAAPRRLKLRPERDDQQYRQLADAIDGQVEQLARGWIDPMRVLERYQHRLPPRHGAELAQQRLEQLLALALWAEVQRRGVVGQRQPLSDQSDIGLVTSARRQQCVEFG